MNRVKLRAAQIIEDKRGEDDSIDIGTIRAALDPKSIFSKHNEKAAVPVRMEADIEQAASDVLENKPKPPEVEIATAKKSPREKQQIYHLLQNLKIYSRLSRKTKCKASLFIWLFLAWKHNQKIF